jgi:hypothetical protein
LDFELNNGSGGGGEQMEGVHCEVVVDEMSIEEEHKLFSVLVFAFGVDVDIDMDVDIETGTQTLEPIGWTIEDTMVETGV